MGDYYVCRERHNFLPLSALRILIRKEEFMRERGVLDQEHLVFTEYCRFLRTDLLRCVQLERIKFYGYRTLAECLEFEAWLENEDLKDNIDVAMQLENNDVKMAEERPVAGPPVVPAPAVSVPGPAAGPVDGAQEMMGAPPPVASFAEVVERSQRSGKPAVAMPRGSRKNRN